MTFDDFNLDEPIARAIHESGFERPTPIQAAAIPPALAGQDVLGRAQTGTGKTAAFLLPILQRIATAPERPTDPIALVVVPTRELALQVAEHAENLGKHLDIRVAAVYGGEQFNKQRATLRTGTDIVVATPGRLHDHLSHRTLRLGGIKVLVLDEADRMLDMGFLPDIRKLLRLLPTERQTLLFSATIPATIEGLAREMQHDPVKVDVAMTRTPDNITQSIYPVPKFLKTPLLRAILRDRNMTSAIVFVQTKRNADELFQQLQQDGINVKVIHGGLLQKQREAALDSFRTGETRVLVATGVAERGLDIEGISHVINFDVPETADEYIHRIGRTARAEATGEALTLVTLSDEPLIHRIEHRLGRKLERKQHSGFNYDVEPPSWAIPTADELSRARPETTAERLARMTRGMRRRR